MEDSVNYENVNNKLTYLSEKNFHGKYLLILETEFSSNFFNSHTASQIEPNKPENGRVSKLSKISMKMMSKYDANNDDKNSLLPNEILVHVIIKNLNENILLKKITLEINELYKPADVIKSSLSNFNKMLEFERMNIRLSEKDYSIYSLKPSKKNGLPNYDLPSINSSTNIYETKLKSLSLVYTNQNAIVYYDKDDPNKSFVNNSTSRTITYCNMEIKESEENINFKHSDSNRNSKSSKVKKVKKNGFNCKDCLVF